MELTIQSLSHRYSADKQALSDLNLTLKPGILGLLGANGAGKSTLMRILATISKPTQGNVFWNNENIVQSPQNLRAVLGYLPQYFGVYENLSATEFLMYLAALKNISKKDAELKISYLLEHLNLAEVGDNPLKSFSGGMKQRVGIAQALLNDPKLLIVDEPTVGLDPEERARFRDLLSSMSEDRIIILSTHIVSDVESIADEIAIMDAGELKAFAPPQALMQQVASKVWSGCVKKEELASIKAKFYVSHTNQTPEGYELRILSDSCPIESAENISPTLEDAFLYLGKSTNLITGNMEKAA